MSWNLLHILKCIDSCNTGLVNLKTWLVYVPWTFFPAFSNPSMSRDLNEGPSCLEWDRLMIYLLSVLRLLPFPVTVKEMLTWGTKGLARSVLIIWAALGQSSLGKSEVKHISFRNVDSNLWHNLYFLYWIIFIYIFIYKMVLKSLCLSEAFANTLFPDWTH